MIVTTYNQHVGSFPPSLWLVCASKVYSGLGADIVMESLHSLTASRIPLTLPSLSQSAIIFSNVRSLPTVATQADHRGTLRAVYGDDDWIPRYNIAPTQPIPVIRQHPKEPRRELSLMRWGLVPHWAKDMSGAASMINARSETAATRQAFRDPMRFRRCLIPADGFYEWKQKGKTKQPFCFQINEGELFAFAGLWDGWKDPAGNGSNRARS